VETGGVKTSEMMAYYMECLVINLYIGYANDVITGTNGDMSSASDVITSCLSIYWQCSWLLSIYHTRNKTSLV